MMALIIHVCVMSATSLPHVSLCKFGLDGNAIKLASSPWLQSLIVRVSIQALLHTIYFMRLKHFIPYRLAEASVSTAITQP